MEFEPKKAVPLLIREMMTYTIWLLEHLVILCRNIQVVRLPLNPYLYFQTKNAFTLLNIGLKKSIKTFNSCLIL